MSVLYLAALALGLGAMAVLDRRFRLFFWRHPRRAGIVLGAGTAFFLVWDLFGIGLGIFRRGETAFMTGIQLAPELPLEELFFLAFLCYLTMNLVQGAGLVLERRARGRARRARADREGARGPSV
ncbi:lycopene cyclase domain-containing protein [Compostimonas suwonensis]|uniref:Lycopene cyclase domain-containing protein n=1 Tax=Compostimonas suwonensis TaxID=1048394 RepID=A0A2M9BZG8_9MICO|nr:lycopene cyclase domain-containing protein [Compostimonas suwonensis]PJJ63479.1 lycopene cyclase domain-containing protein [Compostimonas suwonensis]